MMHLEEMISELEANLDNIELTKPKVSKSTIGWQIEHSLSVFNAVCKGVIKSNPEEYQWKFNFNRMIFLTIGFFPRAKVKAPKFSNPEVISLLKIKEEILNAKSLLEKLKTLEAKSNFKHPIFGVLDLRQTYQFLKAHTYHHLKIIRDIKGK